MMRRMSGTIGFNVLFIMVKEHNKNKTEWQLKMDMF